MFTQTFAHIKGLSNEFHDSTEFEYDSWTLAKTNLSRRQPPVCRGSNVGRQSFADFYVPEQN
jgi:hypothetical protein